MAETIVIEGLTQFRAALQKAMANNQRALTKAIRKAGRPPVTQAATLAPTGTRPDDKHKGQLRGGYRVLARAGKRGRAIGSIVNRTPYAGGAEWGRHGKWKGFDKHGEPGRFAARGVEERKPEIVRIIDAELREIVSIYGWARGWRVASG